MNDHKKRIEAAILKHSKKELTKLNRMSGQGRTNKKPEKETEKVIKKWAEKNGVDLTRVNSQTTYSEGDHYFNKPVDEFGFSDFVGNFQSTACFIEAKAKGKRNTVSTNQYQFLERKIEAGCFACATDSSDHLSHLFNRWLVLDHPQSKWLLKDDLYKVMPKELKDFEQHIDGELFDE